jgi:hypothetical protein
LQISWQNGLPDVEFLPRVGLGEATAHNVTLVRPNEKWIGRCGALLLLFRLVGVPCIAALWRVKSLPRHRGDRPKLIELSFYLGPVFS